MVGVMKLRSALIVVRPMLTGIISFGSVPTPLDLCPQIRSASESDGLPSPALVECALGPQRFLTSPFLQCGPGHRAMLSLTWHASTAQQEVTTTNPNKQACRMPPSSCHVETFCISRSLEVKRRRSLETKQTAGLLEAQKSQKSSELITR